MTDTPEKRIGRSVNSLPCPDQRWTFKPNPYRKENFGAEVLNINLTQIDEDMAEAILSVVQKHALLLFRRQVLHDGDIHRLSKALGSVEEPPAAKDNDSPRFKPVIYLANINSLDGTLISGNSAALKDWE